jgi:hypothetical protein
MNLVTLQTITICIIFAAIFGPLTARSSMRRAPIYGGVLAKAFHLLGASAIIGVVPGVITALILGGGFGVAFPVALLFLAIGFGTLLLFAIFERPARTLHLVQEQSRGWTAEDARTSGL